MSNLPIVFSRLRQIKDVANYDRLPRLILIDAREELERYLGSAFDADELEVTTEEMIEEILMYVADDKLADVGVQALRDDLYTVHSREHEPAVAGDIAVAGADLARALLKKFRELGMYTQEGLFPYVLQNHLPNHTLCLVRYAPDKHGYREEPVPTIHHTMGVYRNGERKHNGVTSANLQNHIAYNITYRPGRALFVDGKCLHHGSLNAAQIATIEEELKLNPVVLREDSAPYH